MEHFKLSTSRDFRINGATLEAALHETIEDEEEQNEEIAEVFALHYYIENVPDVTLCESDTMNYS